MSGRPSSGTMDLSRGLSRVYLHCCKTIQTGAIVELGNGSRRGTMETICHLP